MPGPRHRRDEHPVTLAAHPRSVGLQIRHRRPNVQRPPAPPAVALVIAGAAPPAGRTTITLARDRPDRHHQRPAVGQIHVLDHSSVQTEQLLPYACSAHAATVPFTSVSDLQNSEPRRRRRAPFSCPEVGRSQRPDLIAKQRGAAAAVKRQNQPLSSENHSRPAPASPAPLDQTTTAALPRARVHLTHGTCRGAL